MKNSTPLSPNSPPTRLRRLHKAGRAAEACRRDPNTFVSLCFTDPSGRRIQQAGVHRELQAFLSEHPRALI
jgi:hypothetical protein